MELVCEKYNEKMTAEEAECRHPNEYCKFRSACIISFMEKDNRKERKTANESEGEGEKSSNSSES